MDNLSAQLRALSETLKNSEKTCCYSLVRVLGQIRLSNACRGKNKQETTLFIVNSIRNETEMPSQFLILRI